MLPGGDHDTEPLLSVYHQPLGFVGKNVGQASLSLTGLSTVTEAYLERLVAGAGFEPAAFRL